MDLSPLQFQSAPGGEAGGNFRDQGICRPRLHWFQSAPGGEAGGNWAAPREASAALSFQSAPGGEAGGNVGIQYGIDRLAIVSIRPRR